MAETTEVVIKSDNGNGHKSDDERDENAASNSDLTKIEQDIIRQIEYYFSESNMRRDKFLIQKIEADEGKWVPISVLLTFKRLKELTEDAKVVADTMRKSNNGITEISEDNEKIRRHPDNPLPEFNEARRKELMNRTAYAKGFPLDSTMSIILQFINNNFEKVENVIMRKYFNQIEKSYLFKGSVFILFETKEAAEEFVERPDLKYKEKALLRYMQEEYIKVKRQEEKDKKERRKAKAHEKEAEAIKVDLPRKAILHFVTESESPTLRREDFKKKVLEIEPSIIVSFIHYDIGDKEGNIRFNKENDGNKFLEKLENGKITVNGFDFTLKLVEGDAEEEFLKKAVEDMQRARSKPANKARGRGGNQPHSRKRKNDEPSNAEEAPAKQTKDENVPAVVAVAAE